MLAQCCVGYSRTQEMFVREEGAEEYREEEDVFTAYVTGKSHITHKYNIPVQSNWC